MSRGSSARLAREPAMSTRLCPALSPVARMAPTAAMGTMTSGRPRYQIPMYWATRGRMSSPAPRSRNRGSMVASPRAEHARESTSVNSSAALARRRALSVSPRPMRRAMTEEVPAISPIPKLVRVSTTGNVKVMAASSSAPSCATNQVSAMLNPMSAVRPHTIGVVRRTSSGRSGSRVREGAGVRAMAPAMLPRRGARCPCGGGAQSSPQSPSGQSRR